MPFTLSHPAAVLPLRRSGLPFAALVCGSMAPDLHMLVPGLRQVDSHAWSSLPTIGLGLGLGLTIAWAQILRGPVRACLPTWVRRRLRPAQPWDAHRWLLAVPGVLIGVATHLAWDSFTHENTWGGEHFAILYSIHHGHPGYQWAQYLSSAFGLAVIGGWSAWALRRTTPRPVEPNPRARSARLALGLPAVGAAALGALVPFALRAHGWTGTDTLLAAGLRTTLVVGALGGGLGALGWTLAGRRPAAA